MSETDPLCRKRLVHGDKVAEFEEQFYIHMCMRPCTCVCVCVSLLGWQNGGRWQIAGVPDATQIDKHSEPVHTDQHIWHSILPHTHTNTLIYTQSACCSISLNTWTKAINRKGAERINEICDLFVWIFHRLNAPQPVRALSVGVSEWSEALPVVPEMTTHRNTA